MRRLLARLGIAFWVVAGSTTVGAAAQPAQLARVDIHEIGAQRLESLRSEPGIQWWVELDDTLLVAAGESTLDGLERQVRVERLEVECAPERLRLLALDDLQPEDLADVEVLGRGGRQAVVLLGPGGSGTARLESHLRPFRPDLVVARQWANDPAVHASSTGIDFVQELVDQVDGQRWFDDVEALASFNRYTHGSQILQARDWLADRFSVIPGLVVSTESFPVGSTTAFNVLARRTGDGAPDRWILVGGHYDSTSENPTQSAPGAEDNASGCAGVLEMARILGQAETSVSWVFVCYAGEEQGLYGSTDHATGLVADGDDAKIWLMLNMDMIGYSGDADLDCLLETNGSHEGLLEPFGQAAATYTQLRIVTSLFAFGSDHVPYLDRGMPALLTIENDWDSYPHYHRTSDLPANLSITMGTEILRMNVATVATLDHGILFEDGFESGGLGRWSASSG